MTPERLAEIRARADMPRLGLSLAREMDKDVLAIRELVAETERLAAQSVWPVDERTEIRHGWLVESGYPGDFIGYGMVPDSDAIPLVCLDTIPGYPDLATAEAEANRLRADLRTLAQQVEKVRALLDDLTKATDSQYSRGLVILRLRDALFDA